MSSKVDTLSTVSWIVPAHQQQLTCWWTSVYTCSLKPALTKLSGNKHWHMKHSVCSVRRTVSWLADPTSEFCHMFNMIPVTKACLLLCVRPHGPLSPCPPPWSSLLHRRSLCTGHISLSLRTSEQIWTGWGWWWVCEPEFWRKRTHNKVDPQTNLVSTCCVFQ